MENPNHYQGSGIFERRKLIDFNGRRDVTAVMELFRWSRYIG